MPMQNRPHNHATVSGPMIPIRIRQYTFTLSAPYRPGHPLTQAEATELNALRADKIRNNLARIVEKAEATLLPGQLLHPTTLADIQQQISEFDSKYTFQPRHLSRKPGALDALALEIAEDRLRARAREQGLNSPSDEAIQAEATLPEVQALARERLAIKQRIAQSSLEELL